MSRGRLSTLAVLDEAVERVLREVPGAAGLAVLATLPLRFLEVHFLNRALELGHHAGAIGGYGRYLTTLSWLVTLALPLAFWGRAALAHAVTLSLAGERQVGWRALTLRPAALAAGFYAYLVAQCLVLSLAVTGIGAAVGLLLSGLAVVTVPLQERAGLWAPLRTAFWGGVPLRVQSGLFLLSVLAFGVAFVNLAALFALGGWAAHGLPGLDLTRWDAVLSLGNRHFRLLLTAGAALAVEPFWIASLSVALHRARARQSGEDLRAWFEELTAERAA